MSEASTAQALNRQLRMSFLTAFISLVFAIVGFTYNAWRLEQSEINDNVRTASFELLEALAELEQIIYAIHYDADMSAGSPRNGWVKIGLIADLSMLIDPVVEEAALALKERWSRDWDEVRTNREVVNAMVVNIDAVRAQIKSVMMRVN